MARKPLGLSNMGKPFQCSARLKPGFHMSGESQTIGAFTFCRPSHADISDNRHNSVSDSPDVFGRKWKVRQKWKLA